MGTWIGQGKIYPAGAYEEELKFELFRTPASQQILYSSKTWVAGKTLDESPLHTEIGMLKLMETSQGIANLELLLVHPFGMTEVEVGRIENNSITLSTFNISRAPSAVNNVVRNVRRNFWIEENKLRYQLFLTLEQAEEYLHLDAELSKVS